MSDHLRAPTRNNYFYGQLMTVETFTTETDYFLRQERTFNRLAMGHGVVCGLDVQLADAGRAVVVTPGLAVDRWGRRIVVPRASARVPIPDDVLEEAVERGRECRQDACVQVLIGYHECVTDPMPVHAGDCEDPRPCMPGTLREGYTVSFRADCAPTKRPSPGGRLIRGGKVDYAELARLVTRDCPAPAADPRIVLAALQIEDCPPRAEGDPDITVRPVSPTNQVLMRLLLALLESTHD
ncbi:hypothetical protein ABGB18_28300 [Nonomuraea sp. B12E4]|uniref:hypothetical protein n=1 Tax=Nonomuraea sp. B12E4 TaxID=3153564 RepID=UPI00325C92EC